jgi:hypothetical protein
VSKNWRKININSSMLHGFGLYLNDHVENVNGPPQISSGVLSTEIFWGVDFFILVGIFLFWPRSQFAVPVHCMVVGCTSMTMLKM